MSNLRRLRRQNRDSKEMRVSESLFHRMTNNHIDILENIEFSLVSAYRSNPTIDDRNVAATLEAVIKGVEPTDILTVLLAKALKSARELRTDVADDLWRDGLNVVLQSVKDHSNLKVGNRDYLEFAGLFL